MENSPVEKNRLPISHDAHYVAQCPDIDDAVQATKEGLPTRFAQAMTHERLVGIDPDGPKGRRTCAVEAGVVRAIHQVLQLRVDDVDDLVDPPATVRIDDRIDPVGPPRAPPGVEVERRRIPHDQHGPRQRRRRRAVRPGSQQRRAQIS